MLTIIRWTAKALAAVVALYLIILAVRGGVQSPSLTTLGESFSVLGIAIGVAGLGVVLFREGIGGGLMLAGYLLIAVSFSRSLSMRILHVMACAGALALLAWWLGKKSGKPDNSLAVPDSIRQWITRWQKPLASAALLLVVLFLNEIFFTPPLMSPDLRAHASVVGRWEGRSVIMSDWVLQHRLKIELTVDTAGGVRGSVGDASLAGVIAPNRSWFGSLLGWRTEYLITGILKGMVVAPESISRAEVRIPVNLRGERLLGCVQAVAGGADSRGDVTCNRLSMFRPGPERAVTFRVKPAIIPDASRVYVTGDNDQLGNWEPAGAALDRLADGTWARTFRFPAGSTIAFNCTRGSWRTQALNGSGASLPNMILDVRRDTTVDMPVAGWADIIL